MTKVSWQKEAVLSGLYERFLLLACMQPDTEASWEEVVRLLRLLRGRNRFRGQEYHQRKQNLLRLAIESRGSAVSQDEIRLHITPNLADLHAERLHTGETFQPSQEESTEEFLERLLAICRGKAYVRTALKKASYRPSPEKDN